MSRRTRTRLVVAMTALLGVTGALLTPGVAAAQPSPPGAAATVNLSDDTFAGGKNPCVDASEGQLELLDCRGTVVQRYDVPADLIPPVLVAGRRANCAPGPIGPGTPAITIHASVDVTTTQSTSMAWNESKSNTVQWSVAVTYGFLGPGWGGFVTASFGHSWTRVTGSTYTEQTAIGEVYSLREIQDLKVPGYSWGILAFKPKYSITEVMWTWREPGAINRSASLSRVAFPVLRDSNVTEGTRKVPSGDWLDMSVPMTPAEIDICAQGKIPESAPYGIPERAAPYQPHSLVGYPSAAMTAPAESPILTQKAGAPGALTAPRLISAVAATGPVFEAPLNALQMTGTSGAAYWIGGACTAFTAKIGYGTNYRPASPGNSGDQFEVWTGENINGAVRPGQRLAAVTTPLIPGTQTNDRSLLQADVDVALPTGTEYLIIKTIKGTGNGSDPTFSPGVIVAEPTIDCSGTAQYEFQRSAYRDPVSAVPLDLAGTPEEISADPMRFTQPSQLHSGWACLNQVAGTDPAQPRVNANTACGGGPLQVRGTTYGSGIGLHSSGSVSWTVPPTCSVLTFGVGFDDGVAYSARQNHAVTVWMARLDPKTGTYQAREQIGETMRLSGDGANSPMWFRSEALGTGPRQLVIEVSAENNWEGHVDILNPELNCQRQGATVSPVPPVDPVVTPASGVIRISDMTWHRSSNGWGPIERNSSLGEDAAHDGRKIDATKDPMAIDGYAGWTSGIGMAPYGSGRPAELEVNTGGACTEFSAWVGIDDEVGNRGSSRFSVYADGQRVAYSPVLRGNDRAYLLTADVSGANVIRLSVENGGDSNAYDHADWAEPVLYCAPGAAARNALPVADQDWINPVSYWGPIERNTSLGEEAAGDGGTISIGGVTGWTSGLGMAPSNTLGVAAGLTIKTDGKCSMFTAWVGTDDEIDGLDWDDWWDENDHWPGTVRFAVVADGKPVAISDLLHANDAAQFLVADITGAQQVQLLVDNGGDNNAYDHADWAIPTLHCL